MSIKILVGSSLLAVLLFVGNALAAPLHRDGCETPLGAKTTLCWNAIGEAGDEYGPFPEVHLLPISWDLHGDVQILADYSRNVYRQLLPSGLTHNLIQEWTPVTHLEDAITNSRLQGWSMVLWISPRVLRVSSATSSGLVDWDVYAIRSGRLLRTLRIRVESKPIQANHGVKSGTAVATILAAASIFGTNPISSAAAVAGTIATAPGRPPEAGQSLELMTKLAARQIPSLFQFPMEELGTSAQLSPSTMQGVTGWFKQVLSTE